MREYSNREEFITVCIKMFNRNTRSFARDLPGIV